MTKVVLGHESHSGTTQSRVEQVSATDDHKVGMNIKLEE